MSLTRRINRSLRINKDQQIPWHRYIVTTSRKQVAAIMRPFTAVRRSSALGGRDREKERKKERGNERGLCWTTTSNAREGCVFGCPTAPSHIYFIGIFCGAPSLSCDDPSNAPAASYTRLQLRLFSFFSSFFHRQFSRACVLSHVCKYASAGDRRRGMKPVRNAFKWASVIYCETRAPEFSRANSRHVHHGYCTSLIGLGEHDVFPDTRSVLHKTYVPSY